MSLPSSGTISLDQVNTELGLVYNTFISLDATNVRTLAGVASGLIAMNNLHGKSNMPAKGYISGGRKGAENVNMMEGLAFSNEAIYTLAAVLSSNIAQPTGVNSDTKGYFAGGAVYGSIYATDNIDGLTFSNETIYTVVANLPNVKLSAAGANSSTKGYFAGGFTSGTMYSSINGIVFSNESTYTAGAALTVARNAFAGMSSSVTGYFTGGNNASSVAVSTFDGIVFSSETSYNSGVALGWTRASLAGNNSATKGFIAGGNGYPTGSSNPIYLTAIEGINFSNNTFYNSAAALVTARGFLTGLNSSTKGYFAGGNTGGVGNDGSEIDGINFSNEASYNPAVALSQGRFHIAAVQSGSL